MLEHPGGGTLSSSLGDPGAPLVLRIRQGGVPRRLHRPGHGGGSARSTVWLNPPLVGSRERAPPSRGTREPNTCARLCCPRQHTPTSKRQLQPCPRCSARRQVHGGAHASALPLYRPGPPRPLHRPGPPRPLHAGATASSTSCHRSPQNFLGRKSLRRWPPLGVPLARLGASREAKTLIPVHNHDNCGPVY